MYTSNQEAVATAGSISTAAGMQARVQSGRVSRRHTAATGQSSVRSMGCCTVKAVQRSIPYTLHVQRIVCAALSGPGIDNGSGSGSSCSNSGSSSSSSPASSASDHTGSSSRRQLLLAGEPCITSSSSEYRPIGVGAAHVTCVLHSALRTAPCSKTY